jgi:GT2 family glycosyltransferase
MSNTRLSIIVPVFNKWELTEQCLRSLHKHTPPDVEVMVVDNASLDATPTVCSVLGERLFPGQFHYIRLERNANFGPACTLGAERASAQYLFFLNNDTILTQNWLPPLLTALEDDQGLGAVGPLLLYPGADRVQHAGVLFHPGIQVSHALERVSLTSPLVRKRRSFQAITGAALMMRKDLFQDCGGFHSAYANGLEDLDLCCRIREKGLRLTVVPESVIYHIASQSAGRFDNERRNYSIFLARCASSVQPDVHAFAAGEGFEVRITSACTPCLALPREGSEALAADCDHGKDIAAGWEALERMPYWEEGYDLLAPRLEKTQQSDLLLHMRTNQAYFFPSGENFFKLLRASRHAKRPDVAGLAEKSLTQFRETMSDTERLRAQFVAHESFYRSQGEIALADRYRAAMESALGQN